MDRPAIQLTAGMCGPRPGRGKGIGEGATSRATRRSLSRRSADNWRDLSTTWWAMSLGGDFFWKYSWSKASIGSPCDGSFMFQLTLDALSKLFFGPLQKIFDAMFSHGELGGDLGSRSFITVSHFDR